TAITRGVAVEFPQTSTVLRRLGEKPGNELEEVKLQNASKQIVQNAILQAVQQVSQESLSRDRPSDSRARGQRGGRELTQKHEKK
ncbi:hypothetical protein STEG23_029945, partial [Scotinomys teguina]